MSEQEQPSNKTEDSQKSNGGAYQRRRSWQSSIAAISYINELSKKPELKIRNSDRVTAISLFLATIATVLCLALHKLSGISLQLTFLCDFFLGVSLFLYVCNRLGILTALPPRQAVLTWQLLQAFVFVGVFFTINLTLILSLLLSSIALGNAHLP